MLAYLIIFLTFIHSCLGTVTRDVTINEIQFLPSVNQWVVANEPSCVHISTNVAGAAARYTFTGTAIRVYLPHANNGAKVRISLSDGSSWNYDTFSPDPFSCGWWYEVIFPPSQYRELTVSVEALDGLYVNIEKFVVTQLDGGELVSLAGQSSASVAATLGPTSVQFAQSISSIISVQSLQAVAAASTQSVLSVQAVQSSSSLRAFQNALSTQSVQSIQSVSSVSSVMMATTSFSVTVPVLPSSTTVVQTYTSIVSASRSTAGTSVILIPGTTFVATTTAILGNSVEDLGTPSEKKSNSTSIAIGVLAAVLIVFALAVLYFLHKRRNRHRPPVSTAGTATDTQMIRNEAVSPTETDTTHPLSPPVYPKPLQTTSASMYPDPYPVALNGTQSYTDAWDPTQYRQYHQQPQFSVDGSYSAPNQPVMAQVRQQALRRPISPSSSYDEHNTPHDYPTANGHQIIPTIVLHDAQSGTDRARSPRVSMASSDDTLGTPTAREPGSNRPSSDRPSPSPYHSGLLRPDRMSPRTYI